MNKKTQIILLMGLTFTYLLGVTGYIVLNGIQDLQSIVLFTLSLGLIVFVSRKYKVLKSGEIAEDEMSNMIRDKAGARSFYMSLYLWMFLVYAYNLESEAITYGFAGMALLFALNYAVLKKRGSNIDH